MNSTNEAAAMVVHRIDGTKMIFKELDCGLYVFKTNLIDSDVSSDHTFTDTEDDSDTNSLNDTNSVVTPYSFLATVSNNKKQYTKRDVDKADEACRLYRLLRRPSEASFIRMLTTGSLLNCPVTPFEAKRALAIYGPDVAALKGKTTRGFPSPRCVRFPSCSAPGTHFERLSRRGPLHRFF